MSAQDACQNTDRAKRDLLRLRTVNGMTWREIAALPQYLGIPAGTLCAVVTQDYIPPKWYRRLGIRKAPDQRRGVRLTTQVPADCKERVRQAAEAEGVTVAEWLRTAVLSKLP